MIQFGNDKIKEIYVGGDKIKEVYHGADLVWSKASVEEGVIFEENIVNLGFVDSGYPKTYLTEYNLIQNESVVESYFKNRKNSAAGYIFRTSNKYNLANAVINVLYSTSTNTPYNNPSIRIGVTMSDSTNETPIYVPAIQGSFQRNSHSFDLNTLNLNPILEYYLHIMLRGSLEGSDNTLQIHRLQIVP